MYILSHVLDWAEAMYVLGGLVLQFYFFPSPFSPPLRHDKGGEPLSQLYVYILNVLAKV